MQCLVLPLAYVLLVVVLGDVVILVVDNMGFGYTCVGFGSPGGRGCRAVCNYGYMLDHLGINHHALLWEILVDGASGAGGAPVTVAGHGGSYAGI